MSANTKPILPCEQPEVVEISLIRSREAGLSNDFVPVVELDKTYPEKGFKYVNSSKKCLLSAYIESNQIPLECVQFDEGKDIILRFVVKQGNKAAQDKKGNIHAIGHGVTIISETELNVKYGYKILLKLSPENITPGAYIDFYANDDDLFYYSVQNVHCGRVQIIAKSQCFCNRDITEEELKKIVKNIRDNTYYGEHKITYYHSDKLFHSSYAQVPKEDRTYKKFAEVLNKAFKKYGIVKCSHKIHFLANMYVETMYFTATKEGGKNLRYDPYRGRGFQHLTWESNYKQYQKETGIEIVANYERVANDLNIAADTGAWYWKKQNVNSYAEKDSIFDTSRLINLPGAKKTSQINGYKDREIAWKELKKIFKYPESCVSSI